MIPASVPSSVSSDPTTYGSALRSPTWAPTWAFLAAVTLIRLAVAAYLPLSPDEAYYWTWSKALAPGYLDHPPMVALWIRAGTALLGDSTLGVRLLAPLAAAAGTLLLADAGRRLFGPGAGLRAAVLLNATLMLGVGAVTMTPDTPLLLFWTACAWALARIASGGDGRWWLVAGAAAGLAMDSKYTAALLGIGAAFWLLLPANRRWLAQPWTWAGAVLAILLTMPVVAWNAEHGWASILKQGGRVSDWAPARAGQFLLELAGGQVGLATPWIAVLFAAGAWHAARRWREPGPALCAALILPGALVFLQHALGDRVQANWVAVLYPGCALAAAGAATPTRWWRPAAALGAVLTAALYLQSTLAPVPLPRWLDPSVRLAGWDDLATAAAAEAQRDGAAFLTSDDYGAASLMAWSAPGLPVMAIEPRWMLIELPRVHDASPAAKSGLLLQPARRREPPDPAFWQSAEPLGTLARSRGTVEAEAFRLYRVVPRPGAPAAWLPQPSRPHHAAPDPR